MEKEKKDAKVIIDTSYCVSKAEAEIILKQIERIIERK